MTNDSRLMLQVEANKKSGWVAALLNLIIPGAGYMYCGRWILGIFVFIIIVGIAVASGGIGTIPFVLILFVDGFLAAGRFNKKLILSVLAGEQTLG